MPGIACFTLCAVAIIACAAMADDDDELLANPRFAEGGDGLPSDWQVWTPEWEQAAVRMRCTDDGLLVDSEHPYAVGGLWQDVEGIARGEAYAVEAKCEFDDVPYPLQAVNLRVEWSAGGNPVHPAGHLARGPILDDDDAVYRDIIVAPEDADSARVILELKWPRGGEVLVRSASMRRAETPPARKAKVGTVFLRPSNSTLERNMELWCEQVDKAGELDLDIVCLCEAILLIGTGASLDETAEPIPGPSTKALGEAAKRNNIWVVAGLYEKDGDLLYNTAVLMNREGELAGIYRKTHLQREEWKKGITPGTDYPVFETDFGIIGIQICYDWFFPEPEFLLARNGAEIIFAPTWGNTLPDSEDGRADGETVFRTRARDNGVFMVPSVYDGNSMVIDPLGRILASNQGKEGVFWAEVDLSGRESLPWVGHWRSILPRDRMPETYGSMVEE